MSERTRTLFFCAFCCAPGLPPGNIFHTKLQKTPARRSCFCLYSRPPFSLATSRISSPDPWRPCRSCRVEAVSTRSPSRAAPLIDTP